MKNNNVIIFVDTETGGLNPETSSLLQVGLVLWKNGKIVDKLSIDCLPEKHKPVMVFPQALEVNKINLLEHAKTAVGYVGMINKFSEFITNHLGEGPEVWPVTIGGHNVHFDVNFLKSIFLENNVNWDKAFGHRYVDTASILKFLWDAGVYNPTPPETDSSMESPNWSPISLSVAADFFKLDLDGLGWGLGRHTALGDAALTAMVYSALVNDIKTLNWAMNENKK